MKLFLREIDYNYSSLNAVVKGRLCKKKNYYGCSVRIENSITRDNSSASQGLPRDAEQLPSWQNFQSAPHNH